MISRKFTLLCLLVFGLLFFANAQQENIKFTSLTTKDGLSSNTVNTILKDRYGLIWFGTEDGLNKFDGTNITIYRHQPGNPESLPANEILSLHEDKAGNLWIGTSGGSLSLYDRKQDAFFNFPAKNTPNSIKNNVISAICSDYMGKLWIGHYDGVNVLDPVTGFISGFPITVGGYNPLFTTTITFLFEDSRQQMWIGTTQGLYLYNPKNKFLTLFKHTPYNSSSLGGNNINAIAEDQQGNIWIGTHNGLSKLGPGQTNFVNFRHNDKETISLSSNIVHSIAVEDDNLWIGTAGGLNILNTTTGAIQKFYLDHRNIHSISSKAIRDICIDKDGVYWLGTIGGGVDKYDKNLNLFNYIKSSVFDEKGLKASIVTAFAESEKGLFVGTESSLGLFNLKTKDFQHYTIRSRRSNANNGLSILALEKTRNKQLLIATFADGLFVLDPFSGTYEQLLAGTDASSLTSNDIFCIRQLRNGEIWVGTNGKGINVLNTDFKVIRRYTQDVQWPNDVRFPINEYIRDIMEDRDGNIWIATHGGGIAVFSPLTQSFQIYNTSNSNLPIDKVQSLLEDRNGQIWAATFGGGLAMFNKNHKEFIIYSEKDGLQNSSVYKVLEDEQGLIWVSTNKGISSIDAETGKINNYDYHNGIQRNNFVRGSGIKLSTGELFFGGLEGFNYFHPSNLIKNNNVPEVVITDLRISNRTITPSKKGPIQEHIAVADEMNLDYKQNFALHYVGLNYTAPEKNQYAYKLEGFDKDWNYVGNSTTASYTNLDPGTYIFRVKASNNDGVWNNEGTSIKVIVHPPFWRTIYAYIFYALLPIVLVLYLRHRGIQRIKKKYVLEQEKLIADQERREAERIRELDKLKIKFLTNLSHDFRTPISLILGPVDTLLAQQKFTQSSAHLQMIKRNAKRLLNLVNQLLDFRKMEEHELKLNLSEGEFISFVKETSDSFKDLSERKKIEFRFASDMEELHTLFDHDKLERILFNVLSNAFKFTLEGGKVFLELEGADETANPSMRWVTIKISDTGIGIPHEKKEKIFDQFFQHTTASSILNQGTGIGLSITKEFVKMHGGTIDVESEPGKGTTFLIHFPCPHLQTTPDSKKIIQDAIVTATETEPLVEQTVLEDQKSKLETPTVLLVEDNDDFRFYLKDNLRLHYKVFEAANGKEGWQKTLAQHPQLIVSDISMPEMDGITLCKKIKADKRTSHIPIILLTALTGEENQLRGLQTGANDYISKPFNFELLNVKIKNLLVLNTTLKKTYTKQIKALAPEVELQTGDEILLQTIHQYLEENLTNIQLSVEELSKHVGMSRSSLYNKLLELTGQTPVEYIRSVKLDKAAVLLEKSDMNVAQVAYSVGFSTPNYFAKSFKTKFNMLPSEYINKVRKEGENKTSGR